MRLHRVLNGNWRTTVFMDGRTPRGGADEVGVSFWNGGKAQPAVVLDDLVVVGLE